MTFILLPASPHTQPVESKEISETGGSLFTPDQVTGGPRPGLSTRDGAEKSGGGGGGGAGGGGGGVPGCFSEGGCLL